MSKTIDVREGDRFERPKNTVYQHREGRCRRINVHNVSNWWADDRIHDEYEITASAAKKYIEWWGYTITPAAKPEANPADAPAVKENLTTDVPASSVHLRTDAHLSAVIGRVNGLADWLTALESRLAAEKPADKHAARVVKAPSGPPYPHLFTSGERGVIQDRDRAWKAAIEDAGLTVEAAE